VRLTVGGKTFVELLEIKMDPRVTTPAAGLEQQFKLSLRCYEGLQSVGQVIEQVKLLRTQIVELKPKAGGLVDQLTALDDKLAELVGTGGGRRRRLGGQQSGLAKSVGELSRLLDVLQGADATPTADTIAAADELAAELAKLLARWKDLNEKELAMLNDRLKDAGLRTLDTASAGPQRR
jgi:hypothetical protein